MRAIVPFQVSAVTPAAPARPRDTLTVVHDRSVNAAPGGVATTPTYAIDQKKASR